jgi:ATP-dependent helicase HepA
LEAHQINVVRRVLQDPVQRYLLADEVGLGKTIEAGVLIRQCVLDGENDCNVLVIVPTALVGQWRSELSSKFFLKRSLDSSVHVIALDDHDKIRAILPKATMLVIDEAHHLAERSAGHRNGIYAAIASAAPTIDRVVLLSATPVLHNESEFLEMLHLLDAATYPLGAEHSFRRKVEARQSLAEIVASLVPQNVLFFDDTISQLAAMFPDDDLLQENAADLQVIVENMPAEDDPALLEAIYKLHAHLSEVYKLDRRILRNRRRSITDLTPERSGSEIIHYRSHDRVALTNAIDEWRFDELTKFDALDRDTLWAKRVDAFYNVLGYAMQYADANTEFLADLKQEAAAFNRSSYFGEVVRFMGRAGMFEDRVDALIEALRPFILAKAKCVVFCSAAKTADSLAKRIRERLNIIVDRHDPNSEAWKAFDDSANRQILICDKRAEEGLNFQGGKKIVVHYDLPLNPNRIEQRLGRVDRYGTGDAVRSLVLVCDDDSIEMAWVGYLDDALKVFDRSVASLQYVIDQSARDMARSLFTDGAEAIQDLTARSIGDQGLIEREIKAIDQQDALDALGTPLTDFVDELSQVDADWQSIAADTSVWLDKMLQFGRFQEQSLVVRGEPAPPFRYVYSASSRHTLIPLSAFVKYCAGALDLASTRQGERVIRTISYTFRRRSALQRVAQANGVALLRYGDPLMNGINAFTEADDRGKSFAMWRYEPGYAGDSVADIYLRFDFLLETDIARSVAVLGEFRKRTTAAIAAIRRRADMGLRPCYRSVWLDRELNVVSDTAVLAVLGRPYRVESDQSGALDVNLNNERWERLAQLRLPELTHWSELCFKARASAEDALRGDPEFIGDLADAKRRTLRIDQGRLSQLRARSRSSVSPGVGEELVFEERLAAAIQDGISAPSVRVDTIGALFMSASRHATYHIAGQR